MINELVGERVEANDHVFLRTKAGLSGHVIYGPYEAVDAGKYAVTYSIKTLREADESLEYVCAGVDVVSNASLILASAFVYASDIRDSGAFSLHFETSEPLQNVEYRVYTNGSVPLLVADNPVVTRVAKTTTRKRESTSCSFFNEHPDVFEWLFAAGAKIDISGSDVVVTVSGVSFYARCRDDLNFVNEVFLKNTYNIITPGPSCLIDVGMNIGFTSLFSATKDNIYEIHSFEPFKSTFDRAVANLSLNPNLASKIKVHNIGLSDRDAELAVRINSTDSGSYSVTGSDRGETVQIAVRDAATTLKPIIEAANLRHRLVILKIDCEGSEFAVFRSLSAAGLLNRVAAFMVEWHDGWGTYQQLVSPLVAAGFSVVDLSPKTGNGFFYAVRTAI